jgi:hypothetical protein
MSDLEKAKEILCSGNYTCVLCRDEEVAVCSARGVRPLVAWLEHGERFPDYSAADKVVGKATAFLYVLLGVKAVYAHVMSKGAYAVLSAHGIAAEYQLLAENIINRTGDGICPFEAAVCDCTHPSEAYPLIRKQMERMGIHI